MPVNSKWHVKSFWLQRVGDDQMETAMTTWLNSLPKCDLVTTLPLGTTGFLIIVRELS